MPSVEAKGLPARVPLAPLRNNATRNPVALSGRRRDGSAIEISRALASSEKNGFGPVEISGGGICRAGLIGPPASGRGPPRSPLQIAASRLKSIPGRRPHGKRAAFGMGQGPGGRMKSGRKKGPEGPKVPRGRGGQSVHAG